MGVYVGREKGGNSEDQVLRLERDICSRLVDKVGPKMKGGLEAEDCAAAATAARVCRR
jgi:hypothetical protein